MIGYLVAIICLSFINCNADTAIIKNYTMESDLHARVLNADSRGQVYDTWSPDVPVQAATKDATGKLIPAKQKINVSCLAAFELTQVSGTICTAGGLAPGHTYSCSPKHTGIFNQSFSTPKGAQSCDVTRIFKITKNKKGDIKVSVTQQRAPKKTKS